MESAGDQEIPEKNNSSGDDDQQIPPAAAKSYECTFCKRGFSNAQALGGHMNIHRKDKAKLKQVSSSSSNRSLPNLEIIPKITSYSPILPKTNSLDAIHGDRHIERSTIDAMRAKRAASGPPAPSWLFSDKEGDDDQFNQIVQQLPLFSQTPSNQEHQNRGGQRDQEQVRGDQGDENGLDLDLELRLGPQPAQDSSSTPPAKGATTRKFF